MNRFATEGHAAYSITHVRNGWVVGYHASTGMGYAPEEWVFSNRADLGDFLRTHVMDACIGIEKAPENKR